MQFFSFTLKKLHFIFIGITLCSLSFGFAQVRNEYEISFENAVHHEATIHAVFSALEKDTISLHMQRMAPGQYYPSEFAKNVYNLKITDGTGKEVSVTHPKPHRWEVTGHNGTLFVSYTLFGNYGDGLHAQINQNYALLNTPAVFMYIPSLKDRPIQLNVITKTNPDWKIATQLISKGGNSFLAPDLAYFMDSPLLIGTFSLRSHTIKTAKNTQTIKLAISYESDDPDEKDIELLLDQLKTILEEEEKIFGSSPIFDYGDYTFLICTYPSVSPNHVSHRNSSFITLPNGLQEVHREKLLKNITYEFLKVRNTNRMQSFALPSPEHANLSNTDILWFTEGFTWYYTDLLLKRIGILSTEVYLQTLTQKYNEVWNAPALANTNCIDMSRSAQFMSPIVPFPDPVATHNALVAYDTYGYMLALALDLSLRQYGKDEFDLNGYMKTLWSTYYLSKIPYTVDHLQLGLVTYVDKEFAATFFETYIYQNNRPEYSKLFASMGISLQENLDTSYFGADLEYDPNRGAIITSYVKRGTPAYAGRFEKNDVLLTIDNQSFNSLQKWQQYIATYPLQDAATIAYKRNGKTYFSVVRFQPNPYSTLVPSTERIPKVIAKRKKWLS